WAKTARVPVIRMKLMNNESFNPIQLWRWNQTRLLMAGNPPLRSEIRLYLQFHPARLAREMAGALDETAGCINLVEDIIQVDLEGQVAPMGLPARVEDHIRVHRLPVDADAPAHIIGAEGDGRADDGKVIAGPQP